MAEKLKSVFLVLIKPKKAFLLVKDKELSVWFIALTVLSLVMFVSAFLRMPVMQKESKKALAAQIKLMEKQSQEAQTRGEPLLPKDVRGKGFDLGFIIALTALMRVDIFVLWSLVLLAVGVTVFANLTKTKAALFALSYWFIAWLASLPIAGMNG